MQLQVTLINRTVISSITDLNTDFRFKAPAEKAQIYNEGQILTQFITQCFSIKNSSFQKEG